MIRAVRLSVVLLGFQRRMSMCVWKTRQRISVFIFRATQQGEYLYIHLFTATCCGRLLLPSSWRCVVRKVKTDTNLINSGMVLPRIGKGCYCNEEQSTPYRSYLKLTCKRIWQSTEACVCLFTYFSALCYCIRNSMCFSALSSWTFDICLRRTLYSLCFVLFASVLVLWYKTINMKGALVHWHYWRCSWVKIILVELKSIQFCY